MGATESGKVLETLELDPSIIESLPEAVLSELVGFIEYDNRLARSGDERLEQEDGPRHETVGAVSYPTKPASWGHNRVSRLSS